MYNFELPPSLGKHTATGVIRQLPEDFQVTESISFAPSGEGDHLYLYVQKTSTNTDWVAKQLADLAGLKAVDVGYAGLKDRHAITRQWFSLHMPNQAEPDWHQLPAEIMILEKKRHNKKLRTGAIEKNRFELRIRQLEGDLTEIEQRLQTIKNQGFPNYFGPQRFGNQGANVYKLAGMARGKRRMSRTQRALYVSAGRSYLFNQVLTERVKQQNWQQPIAGDVMALQGSRSIFVPEAIDQTIIKRVMQQDIHPAAMLWGRGDRKTSRLAGDIEQKIIDAYPDLTNALSQAGVEMAYRAMRMPVPDLSWEIQSNEILLRFSLASGAYATSLLNEFIHCSNNQ